jgi:ribosomal-protein-alanine N-acetyltransferase
MTKFKLRAWDISDLKSLVKYANNWNIAKNLTDKSPFPYTAENGIQLKHMIILKKI